MPVARSHTITVSRWLVMPIAATSRGRAPSLAQRLHGAGQLAGQDLRRIVLHPPRLRIELLELMLRHGGNRARLVKQNRPRTRRPLVQCKNVSHACSPLSDTSQTRQGAT